MKSRYGVFFAALTLCFLATQFSSAQLLDSRTERKRETLYARITAPFTTSFAEGFENTTFPPTTPSSPGLWYVRNASTTIGTNAQCWNRFTTTPWAPQAGAGHAGANFNCTTGTNTISAWLISPLITFNNGDKIRFWTRTAVPGATEFPDRLQLRMALDPTDPVPATPFTSATDVGTYTILLVDVNPTLAPGVYPQTYTQFIGTVSGLGAPTVGRFAFRYFVTNGGPTGANSNILSIDSVEYFNGTTAAGVNVSGRVLTPDGRGVRNAKVTITDQSGNTRTVMTGANGSYGFEDVESGQTYVVSVVSRRYEFSPRIVNVGDSISDLDFVAESSNNSSK